MLTDEQIAVLMRPLYLSDAAAEMGLPDDIAAARLVEAATLKAHQQAIEAAVLAEREALARRADSIGHHWSGAPATAFFEFAEEIRSRTQNMRIPDTHK